MIDPQDITAVVLCGGQSTRWNSPSTSIDKGLVMIDAVLATVRPQVGAVVISANRNQAAYAQRGHPIVQDASDHAGLGPLAGIAAAVPALSTSWVCWCPCDVPAAPADWVRHLATVVNPSTGPSFDVAYFVVNGLAEPLFALARTSWVADAQQGVVAYLARARARGERSVVGWLNSGRYFALQVAGPQMARTFKNHNFPDD